MITYLFGTIFGIYRANKPNNSSDEINTTLYRVMYIDE